MEPFQIPRSAGPRRTERDDPNPAPCGLRSSSRNAQNRRSPGILLQPRSQDFSHLENRRACMAGADGHRPANRQNTPFNAFPCLRRQQRRTRKKSPIAQYQAGLGKAAHRVRRAYTSSPRPNPEERSVHPPRPTAPHTTGIVPERPEAKATGRPATIRAAFPAPLTKGPSNSQPELPTARQHP